MRIFAYNKRNNILFFAEKDESNGEYITDVEAMPTNKDYSNVLESLNIGKIIYVNKYGANNKLIGFKAEIISLSVDDSPIKDKINKCKTLDELDSLRREIVLDKDNFSENQKLFILKKNKIK